MNTDHLKKDRSLKSSQESKKETLLFTLAFCILSLFSEIYLYQLVNENALHFKAAVFIHCLLVLISSILLFAYIKLGWNQRFISIHTIMLCFLGPFGSIISSFSICLYFKYRNNQTSLKELIEEFKPENTLIPSEKIYESLLFEKDDIDTSAQFLPYKDILYYGSEKQKRVVLEKIQQFFHPSFSHLLLIATADPSSSIRMLAATSIANIDRGFFLHHLELEKNYRLAPNDPTAIYPYALHCELYASLGLFSEDRTKRMRLKAIEAMEKLLSICPNHDMAILSLGKLYLKNGDSQRAKLLLEKLYHQKTVPDPELKKWYLTILFELRDYAKIRHLLSKAEEENFSNEDPFPKLTNSEAPDEIRDISLPLNTPSNANNYLKSLKETWNTHQQTQIL